MDSLNEKYTFFISSSFIAIRVATWFITERIKEDSEVQYDLWKGKDNQMIFKRWLCSSTVFMKLIICFSFTEGETESLTLSVWSVVWGFELSNFVEFCSSFNNLVSFKEFLSIILLSLDELFSSPWDIKLLLPPWTEESEWCALSGNLSIDGVNIAWFSEVLRE